MDLGNFDSDLCSFFALTSTFPWCFSEGSACVRGIAKLHSVIHRDFSQVLLYLQSPFQKTKDKLCFIRSFRLTCRLTSLFLGIKKVKQLVLR